MTFHHLRLCAGTGTQEVVEKVVITVVAVVQRHREQVEVMDARQQRCRVFGRNILLSDQRQ